MGRPTFGWTYNDAFTGWRRVLSWRSGARSKIKKQYRRWERRQAKDEIRHEQKGAT